jgi:hypothetical protein
MKVSYILPARSSLESIAGVVEETASHSGLNLPYILAINLTGSNIGITGTAHFTNTNAATSTTVAPVTFGGGIGVVGDIYANKVHGVSITGTGVFATAISGTVYLPTSGGTPSPLAYYEEKSFGALALTGAVATTTACTATKSGNIVNLNFAASTPATASTDALTLSSSAGSLTSGYAPSVEKQFACLVYNNAAIAAGTLKIATNGAVTFYVSPQTTFTPSANCGVLGTSVSYTV